MGETGRRTYNDDHDGKNDGVWLSVVGLSVTQYGERVAVYALTTMGLVWPRLDERRLEIRDI